MSEVEVQPEQTIIELKAVENPQSRANSMEEFRKELANLAFASKSVEPPETTVQETLNAERHNESVNEERPDNIIEEHDGVDDVDSDIDGGDVSASVDHNENKIPKSRFNKELAKRKDLEEKLRDERDARIKYETELKMYSDAFSKLNKPAVQEPAIDPLDMDAHQYYMQKIADLENRIEKSTQNLTQTTQQNRFEADINSQALEFSRKTPDFEDAYQYVMQKEVESAKLIGLSDHQAQEFAMQKLQPMAWKIYNDGGNVPETLYKLAKNYGYAGKNAPKTGPNLKNLQKNMPRSASVLDDVSAVSVSSTNPESNYVNIENFKQLHRNDGRGIDPDKFRKVLAAVQRGEI